MSDREFEAALEHHRAGRLGEAERIYSEILARRADHADALHFLGVVCLQTGRVGAGIDLIRRAIAINPSVASYHDNLGSGLRHIGRFDEAAASYRRAIQLSPQTAEAHCNLGALSHGMGDFAGAIAAFRQALAIKPDFVMARTGLADALRRAGQLDPAIAEYRRVIAAVPNNALALNNLAVALRDRGKLHESIAQWRRAIALKPDFVEALSNVGVALCEAGEFAEARDTCRAALQKNPLHAGATANLAIALRELGRLDEALATARRAIELKPELAAAHCNLGNILRDMGDIPGAIAACRLAADLAPTDAAIHSVLLYSLYFDPRCEDGEIAAEHRRWVERHAAGLQPATTSRDKNAPQHRRLRIGYVSPDFRVHPVGRFLLPLLENHDRQKFEIYCYAGVVWPDDLTIRLQRHADAWRDIRELSDEEGAQLVREDQIDILIDLTMHMAGGRPLLFARKPAPVQATYLAYAGTMGMDAIEFRITDPHLDPPGHLATNFCERPIRLAKTYWCYQPPIDSIPIAPLPANSGKPITFGCLNNFSKVTDATLATWAEIMGQAARSRLLLHAPAGSARERVLKILSGREIEADRVEFVERLALADYLQTYNAIDIALDPFPYVGGTTTCDALWMGVPVVTLRGRSPIARGGASILSNIRLSEWIADSRDAYIEIATKMAGNLQKLSDLRSGLRQRMAGSPLMDAKQFASDMEDAYRRMWES